MSAHSDPVVVGWGVHYQSRDGVWRFAAVAEYFARHFAAIHPCAFLVRRVRANVVPA